MLHICMYYILFKIRVLISPKFENEIAKVYIKSFPTYIFFKSHIFIKFLATMRPQNFRNLSCKSMPTRFQEKIVSHQKLKKKQFRRNNWRCTTKNANATGEKA